MKIYLLNPPFKPNFVRCGRWQGASARSGGLDYPKFLAYTTGLLEKEFNDVKLVDAVAEKWGRDDVVKDVSEFKPDLIVVSTNFSSLSNDIEVASLLKNNKEVTTVLVGPPASQYSDKILETNGVDIVARYEYDFTIKELAHSLENNLGLKNVRGISYKKAGRVIHNPDRDFTTSKDLDSLPFVSKVYKKHLKIKDYFLSQSLYPEIQILTGRGCPNLCTFCSWPKTLTGRKYRSRSPSNIADEFEWVKKNLPEVKEIFIEDDTFTIKKRLVKDFCEELIKRKIDISWSCNSRADLDYETMKKMKQAGCRLLIVGYESGNEIILENIRKGVTKKQMSEFSKDAKKAKLLLHGDFIVGLPGETNETVSNTFEFIKEIKPDILQVSIASPIPGTEFYEWVNKNSYLLTRNLEESICKDGFQKCIISYPNFDKVDIETNVDDMLKKYYLNCYYPVIVAKNIFRKNGFDEFKRITKSMNVFVKYMERDK